MQTRIITGTYGTSFYNDNEDAAPRIKRAKPGRPPKAPVVEYFKTNDLFGRVPDTVTATTTGRVVVGRAGIRAVYANDTEE